MDFKNDFQAAGKIRNFTDKFSFQHNFNRFTSNKKCLRRQDFDISLNFLIRQILTVVAKKYNHNTKYAVV